MIATRSDTVAFVGYGTTKDLVLVLTPPGSPVDPRQGVSLEYARLFVGRDGDVLRPLAAQCTAGRQESFIGTEPWATYAQVLVAPEGIFARNFMGMSQTPVTFSWQPANGNIRYMRPLDPAHFDIVEKDGQVRITSKPRSIHFVGEIEGGEMIIITTIGGDIRSAECFTGRRSDGMASRRRVLHIMPNEDNSALYSLDVQSIQFTVSSAREYRRAMPFGYGMRRGLPRTGLYITWGGLRVRPLSHDCITRIDQPNGEIHFTR
jgi:hypothetical protein